MFFKIVAMVGSLGIFKSIIVVLLRNAKEKQDFIDNFFGDF
jgi:hypothetical protein